MKHFCHIIRHNSLEKTIIQGSREERQRETSKKLGDRHIEEWARTNIGEATRMAERRDLWCTVSSTSQQLNLEPSEQREKE